MPNYLKRILGDARRYAFKTNHAFWYCKQINTNDNVQSENSDDKSIKIDCDNFHQIVEWIGKKSTDFPWIYNQSEVDFAKKYSHSYPFIKLSDEIVGYVKIALTKAYIEDYESEIQLKNDEAFICDTFILPQYRGKHLARKLLIASLAELKKKNILYVFCHIPVWNQASVRLYRHCGFNRISYNRYIRLFGIHFFTKDPVKIKEKGRNIFLANKLNTGS